MKNIKEIFKKEKIEYFSITPINKEDIINPRLMPENANKAIVFLIPYKTSCTKAESLAHFAQIKDYHGFSKMFFERIIPEIQNLYPQNRFFGFADHSPLNERKVAARCGLGCIGKNGLLLNEKYGSYVFIGEILTDAPIDDYILSAPPLCTNCDLCIKACPKKEICLSELSQKKRKSEEDYVELKKNGIIWGCDICQETCPANIGRELSPFSYFYEDKIRSPEEILSMSDDKFNQYSFSYRGRKVIEENIKNILKKDID